MKIFKIVLGIGLAVALSSCGTTKTASTTVKKDDSVVKTVTKEVTKPVVKEVDNVNLGAATANVMAKKGKMSKEEVQKWPHMDIYKDSVPGMSLDKAYEFVKNKKGQTVIVGVIDSGIDIEHEDLKNVLWTNKDEIPNNGKDDDNNGYIDDVYGWNFLGGEKGSSAPEQLEITRMVKKMHGKYGQLNDNDVTKENKEGFDKYYTLKKKVDKERKEAEGQKAFYSGIINSVKEADAIIKKSLGKENYTLEDLEKFESEEKAVKEGKGMLMRLMGSGATLEEGLKDIQGAVDYFGARANTMYNVDFKGRVTGDDPEDITDTKYGNNYVIGSKDDEIHGTHVSGIICAERNNGVGMNGVAHNVALMSIRAVPDGDEYDKDVALAIRYAVDNGAKVVNMSFGKSYSPHPGWVYDAIRYAAKHDVLLVHAAGNDHSDIDSADNFPNDSKDKRMEFSDNVLTVGAMTRHFNEKLAASFSNYGKLNVDVFAPGLEIYSTFPKDEYKSIQGTSMASPEVAGVAALVRSYYPSLTASQVKHIIMKSGIEFNKEVKLPAERGEKESMVDFNTLSVSGKILNAYNALVLSDKMVSKNK